MKTCVLFETKSGKPRSSLLLRLPPPSVSLTPEVRCAVVGNVDSGKSTTLGVLTRGTPPDSRSLSRYNCGQVPLMTAGAALASDYSDTSMKLRPDGPLV